MNSDVIRLKKPPQQGADFDLRIMGFHRPPFSDHVAPSVDARRAIASGARQRARHADAANRVAAEACNSIGPEWRGEDKRCKRRLSQVIYPACAIRIRPPLHTLPTDLPA